LSNRPNFVSLQSYLLGEVGFNENLEGVADCFGVLLMERVDSLLRLSKRRQTVKQSPSLD